MSESPKKSINFGEFSFEVGSNLLLRRGAVIPLEPMAGRVLSYLLENGGRLVSKDELLDAVWREVFTTEDVLKRAVSQIRRALGDDAANPRFIETHHRRGYRFIIPENLTNGHEKTENKAQPSEPNFDCFVGRDAAMNALQTEFRRVIGGQNGQPILLSGEPGIGKTQTATRFAEWARETENALPLRVRFFDYEASYTPPINMFLDLLREGCANIFEQTDDLRSSIEAKLDVNLPDDLFAKVDGGWRASADASRMIAPLAECFVRLSRFRPIILLLDDVQWADETSRQIIGYLMRIAKDAPLMILGLTRRAEAENPQGNFAGWLQKQAAYRSFTTLELSPLSLENYRELINEVFRGGLNVATISAKDWQKLHSATGGNPYFTVETLRLLLNEKVIEKSVDGWVWRGIADVPLPETVRMAARAKLVNLSVETRDLIECAAILGDAFELETLEIMLQNEGENWSGELFNNNLDEAVGAQILSEQNVSGTDDCQFYHTTLRRAVYMDLSPRRRKRLHARAAHAVEMSHRNEIGKAAAALGAHWENAGDLRMSFQWNMQACRAAAGRFDWGEAAEILNRLERITAKLRETKQISDEELLRFLSLRGEVYMSVGRRIEAEKVLLAAVSVSEKIGETEESPIVLLNLGRTCILLGKYREAIPFLEKSLEISRNHDHDCAARIQLASAIYGLCDYEKSCEILQKIIAEEPVTSYNRAVALGKLGWTRALQSRYAEAKKLLEEALHFHDTAGDLRERAVLSMCLNTAEHGTGNYESAIAYAKRARAEAQIVGEPYNESIAMMRIARSRISQGLYTEAETLLLAVREKQKSLDSLHARAETLWMLGRVRTEKGEYETASKDLSTARQMVIEVGDKDDEFQILHDEARLQIRLNNFAEAIVLSDEAARIAEEIGVAEGIGESLFLKAEALSASANFAEAVPAARESVKILAEFVSGERWQAHYALAKALNGLDKKDEEIETSLRRTIEILDSMRGQLADDEARFAQSTQSLNAPARDLRDFLVNSNRKTEALEIGRLWMLD
jgi:DNA-binding winged helix-turn-helix (wHTH) protein/tetratricopeptide (TPR) repeat protein